LLDQFDAVVKLGSDGRARHTGATRRLNALALEAGRIVRVMDARNRLRFKNDQQALGAWINASRITGRPTGNGADELPGTGPQAVGEQGGTPGAGGDIRPAA
jgi:hypothetical protein